LVVDLSVADYIAAGSLQCAASLTTQGRLDAAVAGLKAQGANVIDSYCGGMKDTAFAAVCGGQTGEVFVVQVTHTAISILASAGFHPVSELPGVIRQSCGA
jgi:hypothetical protein